MLDLIHRRGLWANRCAMRNALRSFSVSSMPSNPNPNADAERQNQTIILPCGRQLGYAEYGPIVGRPLFFLHGYPSSRYEPWMLERIASKKGIRIICPDRPGFGLSTLLRVGVVPRPRLSQGSPPPPTLSIADYPQDVLALADHLRLSTFAILGGSGGGPFALACAFPHLGIASARITNVGLMASGGPWNIKHPQPPIPPTGPTGQSHPVVKEGELKRDVLWTSYILYLGAWYAPKITRWVLDGIVAMARWMLNKKGVQNRLDRMIASRQASGEKGQQDRSHTISPDDAHSKSASEIRHNAGRTILEAFAQGAEGAVHEARLLTGDWDLGSWAGVGGAVKIWHGRKDVNAPIAQIRYLAQKIPGCQLKEYDEDHFGLVRYLDEILDEMVGEDKKG